MQLDHADDNNVYTDACVGDDAQQSINEYDSTTGRTVFVSYWGIVNEGLYLCLSESAGEMIASYCGTPYTQYGLGVIDG
jgi:hypothetical protein